MRAVVLAAAALAVAALGWNLLEPRGVLAGSNNVAPQSLVAAVAPGQQLCLPGLEIPSQARSVLVVMQGEGAPRPALPGSIAWEAGGTNEVVAAAEAETGAADAEFALPGDASGGPAELCFTTPAQLSVAGTEGTADLGPPPTLDGAPVDARASVRYPRAGETSRLALLPTLMERATRFKPVDAWAGWLALLGAIAGTVAAVAVVLRARALSRRRITSAVAAIALVQAVAFAVLTPPFDGPDEPDHFAYVESVARSGHVADEDPASPRPAYSDRHGALLQTLRHRARVGSALGKAIYTERDEAAWRTLDDGLDAGNGGGTTTPTRVHSPLYYGLLGAGYWPGALLGGETGAHLGARLISALALLIIALAALGVVRELAPRRPELAAAAGLLVALQPQLGFMSGVVNSDAGVNAAAAVVIWLAVRALRRPPDVRRFGWLGAALAVAVLMKATAFSLGAVLALAGLAVLVRHGRVALAPVLAAVGAFALPLIAYGLLAPELGRGDITDELAGQLAYVLGGMLVILALAIPVRMGRRALAATAAGAVVLLAVLLALGDATPLGPHLDSARVTATYVWQIFLPRPSFMADQWAQGWPATFRDVYVRQTFGGYGQLAHVIPNSRAYVVLAGAGVLLVAAAVTVRRRPDAIRSRGWELALLLAAPVAVVLAIESAHATAELRAVPAEQGRYFLTAAAPVAALAALALAGLRPTTARAAAAVAVIAMAALALDGRFFYLSGTYL